MREETYKGIPLSMWKHERLLETLDDYELAELHAIMYCSLLDMIEPIVDKSPMVESMLIIDRIMKK